MKLKTPKLKAPHLRRFSWKALPIFAIISLLASVGYLAFTPIPQTFAQDEVAQTAKYLPADTQLYFMLTKPDEAGMETLEELWNNWWQDPAFQHLWEEMMAEWGEEVSFIEDNVLPYLDKEIALGMRNFAAIADEGMPDVIIFVGTNYPTGSLAFVNSILEAVGEEQIVPTGTYDGIDVYYDDTAGIYIAFPEDYIIASLSQDFLEECLDLYLGTTPVEDSLYNTDNFADALDHIGSLGMFYCDVDSLWDAIAAAMGLTPEEIAAIAPYIPAYIAGSLSYTANGISTTVYCPLPEGITMPTGIGDDPLYAAEAIPGNALLYMSSEDMNAWWGYYSGIIAETENWDAIGEMLVEMGIIQPDEWPASFDEAKAWLNDFLGIDIDTDIFGWMTGEYAFALLPLDLEAMNGEDAYCPDFLILFEVENQSQVQAKLTVLFAAINAFIPDDPLQISTTTIGGVSAILLTNDAIAEVGASPGCLFLDVGSPTYLIIGSTTGALEAAVSAHANHTSLSYQEGYQGVLSMLPESKMGLTYINIHEIMDMVVSQMSDEEKAEFDATAGRFLAPLYAFGWSGTLVGEVGEEGMSMNTALYVTPSREFAVTEDDVGTTLELPEQTKDLGFIDPNLGNCASDIDVEILGCEEGSNIETRMVREYTDDIRSAFVLAATDAGLNLDDVAYVVEVDKTNLTAADIGTATITMKVGKDWADSYGIDNIKIFHIDDEGNCQILDTTFVGYEGDYAVFQAESPGLSTFGLVATSLPQAAKSWWSSYWWVVPIIVTVAIIIGVNVWRRRRTI